MKKILLLILLLTSSISNTIYGQEFLGIKVEGSLNSVLEKFKAKGFKTISADPNTPILKGMAGTENIELLLFASPISKTVYKFVIYFDKQDEWEPIKSRYEEYLKVLSDKYGDPKDSYSYFSSPYKEGEGDEMEAVAMEKCHYFSHWKNGLTNFNSIGISISEFKQVKITYENSKNFSLRDSEDSKLKKEIF